MKILIADDHALFREGLRQIVQPLAEEADILEAHDWQTALAHVAQEPDMALALMDLGMPGMEAFTGLKTFLDRAETVPVVVISASESVLDMKRALDAGAMGYVAKSEARPVMLSALRLVLSGGIYVPPRLVQSPLSNQSDRDSTQPFGLTPRQFEVLNALVQGKSNKQIARDLNLSGATVKAHVGAIFKTLNVNNRLQAIRMAENVGMRSGHPVG